MRYAMILVLLLGCSGTPATQPDDGGFDSRVSIDSGSDAGFDAGHDAGVDSGATDSGMDGGVAIDAGPCDCASVGPCCDGCHLAEVGTPCAASESLTVASTCVSGATLNKAYDWLSCSAAGQCNVTAGPGHVYWSCTGSCPQGQTCTGSCITSGLDRCAVYSGCAAGTPQAYFDLGICP